METPAEMRARLMDKAAADEGFRARLLSDPKQAVQEALGVRIPDSVSIQVHEESLDGAHLVLPPSSKLSESDLQIAAGGFAMGDLSADNPDWNPANW